MADIQSSSANALTALEGTAPQAQVSGAGVLVAFNFPTEAVQVSGAQVTTALEIPEPMRASSVNVLVVGRGRVQNPKLRSWTFTLDNHEFFVLRLGDSETLVYDAYSKQWVTWDSGDLGFWRPNVGMNWLGATVLAEEYGSNIVVGDDTFGLLWFLDPELSLDESPRSAEEPSVPFTRILMGQIPVLGREVVPCNVVYLSGDPGDPVEGAFLRLELSDDGGFSFQEQGDITVTPGDWTQEFAWRSLGQAAAPGRLFKITDNGAFARVDSLDMNDGE